MDYYDAILGLIPLALLALTVVLTVLGVSMPVAVPLAASVSAALVGHAMFVRTPRDPVVPVVRVGSAGVDGVGPADDFETLDSVLPEP